MGRPGGFRAGEGAVSARRCCLSPSLWTGAIDAHSEASAMVGDRMDTDIVSGLEAGMHTVLVLTGITSRAEAERFPYLPSRIVDSIADLVDELD